MLLFYSPCSEQSGLGPCLVSQWAGPQFSPKNFDEVHFPWFLESKLDLCRQSWGSNLKSAGPCLQRSALVLEM